VDMPRPLTIKERRKLRKAIAIMKLRKEKRLREKRLKKFSGIFSLSGSFVIGIMLLLVFVAAYLVSK
tara:strand:+ start:201 stop:401 length:201 start_codon:yes stop_codon:yes gene_type:complete